MPRDIKSSKWDQFCKSNKHISNSKVYKKKGRSFQSVAMLPKDENDKNIANNDDQGPEYCSK